MLNPPLQHVGPGNKPVAGASLGRVGRQATTRALSTKVADRLENEIVRSRIPKGTFLGSEKQLADRFAVGRATLRSAIRQLETLGIAKVRSGHAGGLFVTGDASDAATNRLSAWLMSLRLRFTDVAWSSWLLLQYAAVRAARRLDPNARARLIEARDSTFGCTNAVSAYIDHRTRLRLAIIAAADNPALLILFRALDRTWRETLLPYEGSPQNEIDSVAATRRGDQDLVEAILARDEVGVRARAAAMAAREQQHIAARVALGRLPAEAVPKVAFVATPFGGQRLSALTLRALHGDIRRGALAPGAWLGTMAELSLRYGVSLDVMREAVALAERDGLVSVHRGRGGGIRVAKRLRGDPKGVEPNLFRGPRPDDRHLDELEEVIAFGREIRSEGPEGQARHEMLDVIAAIVGMLRVSQSDLRRPKQASCERDDISV